MNHKAILYLLAMVTFSLFAIPTHAEDKGLLERLFPRSAKDEHPAMRIPIPQKRPDNLATIEPEAGTLTPSEKKDAEIAGKLISCYSVGTDERMDQLAAMGASVAEQKGVSRENAQRMVFLLTYAYLGVGTAVHKSCNAIAREVYPGKFTEELIKVQGGVYLNHMLELDRDFHKDCSNGIKSDALYTTLIDICEKQRKIIQNASTREK